MLGSGGDVTLAGVQTLTNKTVALGSNTVSGTLAQFNTACTDADFQTALVSGTSIKTVNSTSLLGAGNVAVGDVTLAGVQTLTSKTIALGSNTVSGTLAQFNTAVTDADFATLAGSETLTNKTLTGYTETVYALAGTVIDVTNGTVQTKTLSANTTFTESLADGQSVILGITAGAYSVTWPTTTWVKVGGSGTAPTLTSTGVNWIILWQVGGTLRGAFLGTA